MMKYKNKQESFNTRANNILSIPCYKLEVSNYGEHKSSFIFYTPSASYCSAKKDIIKKKSPDAIVKEIKGVINFVEE